MKAIWSPLPFIPSRRGEGKYFLDYVFSIMDSLVRQFLDGSGELHFENSFLSPRIVKDALEKNFRVVAIEESTSHLRYKIIRLFRLYGCPAIFPQARIDITIHKENSRSSLYWHFVWSEYIVFLVSVILLFAAVVLDNGVQMIPFLLFAVVLSTSLVFLGTKWVSRGVRKVFKELIQGGHNKTLKRAATKHRRAP